MYNKHHQSVEMAKKEDFYSQKKEIHYGIMKPSKDKHVTTIFSE